MLRSGDLDRDGGRCLYTVSIGHHEAVRRRRYWLSPRGAGPSGAVYGFCPAGRPAGGLRSGLGVDGFLWAAAGGFTQGDVTVFSCGYGVLYGLGRSLAFSDKQG